MGMTRTIGERLPWYKTFVIFPKKTISGKLIFLQSAYTRQVLVAYGDARFHFEPEREYATIFDILAEDDDFPI